MDKKNIRSILLTSILYVPLFAIAGDLENKGSEYLIWPNSSASLEHRLSQVNSFQVNFELYELLSNPESLQIIKIRNGVTEAFSVSDISATSQGNLSISLSSESSSNYAILTVGNDNYTYGVIEINGQNFTLISEKIEDELVFIINESNHLKIPDHDSEYFTSDDAKNFDVQHQETNYNYYLSLNEESTINILVAHTPSARNDSSGMIDLYIDTLVAQTNLSFENAGIENIKVKLAASFEIEEYPYPGKTLLRTLNTSVKALILLKQGSAIMPM